MSIACWADWCELCIAIHIVDETLQKTTKPNTFCHETYKRGNTCARIKNRFITKNRKVIRKVAGRVFQN